MKRKVLGLTESMLAVVSVVMILIMDMFAANLTMLGQQISTGVTCKLFEVSNEAAPFASAGILAPLNVIGVVLIVTLVLTALSAFFKSGIVANEKIKKLAGQKIMIIFPVVSLILSLLFMFMSAKFDASGMSLCFNPEISFYLLIVMLIGIVVCNVLGIVKVTEKSKGDNTVE